MMIALSAPLLALGFFVQSAPPSGAPGSAGTAGGGGAKAGAATVSSTVKKRGHDLADILLPLAGSRQRSGTLAPPSPPGGGNVHVSSPNPKPQYQPSIVVDPTDRLHLVGTALDRRNDRMTLRDQNAAFYASFDGGATWSEFLDTHLTPPGFVRASAVAFGPEGETYLFRSLAAGPSTTLNFGISNDGGVTEPTWSNVPASGSEPSVAVDTTEGPYRGTIYVASVDVQFAEGYYFQIAVSRSSDGGQNWDDADVSFFDDYHSPSIAVDASGVVHVAYWNAGGGTIESASSSDGGATWGAGVTIANAAPFDIPHLTNGVPPAPRLAIDASGGPYDDSLYVAWAQAGGSTGPDVVFSRSIDHGATWSAPVPASDVTNNSQFSPAVSVDAEGTLHFGFHDARDDAANQRVNYYLSRSSDGGASLLPNVKLSDVDFDPTTYPDGPAIALGSGVAASDRLVHALWTDGRIGNNNIFGAAANLDCFTDVATISAATGGTANFTIAPGPLFGSTEYHVLGSLSGTTPGTDFFFENVPINYDLFTLATIYDANSNVFPGFTGALDTTGAATAQLVSGPLPPELIGVQMDFAALVRVNNAVRWGSAPTSVVIGN